MNLHPDAGLLASLTKTLALAAETAGRPLEPGFATLLAQSVLDQMEGLLDQQQGLVAAGERMADHYDELRAAGSDLKKASIAWHNLQVATHAFRIEQNC